MQFNYNRALIGFFSFVAGPPVVGDMFLEVIRAFYSYCKDTLGSDLKLSYSQSGNVLSRYLLINSTNLIKYCLRSFVLLTK